MVSTVYEVVGSTLGPGNGNQMGLLGRDARCAGGREWFRQVAILFFIMKKRNCTHAELIDAKDLVGIRRILYQRTPEVWPQSLTHCLAR